MLVKFTALDWENDPICSHRATARCFLLFLVNERTTNEFNVLVYAFTFFGLMIPTINMGFYLFQAIRTQAISLNVTDVWDQKHKLKSESSGFIIIRVHMIWCHGIRINWASELSYSDDIDIHLKSVEPIEMRKNRLKCIV